MSVRKDDNKKSTLARKDCRLTTSPPHELFKPRSGRESDRDEGIFECLAGPKQNAKTKRHAIHVMFYSFSSILIGRQLSQKDF